ncbi:hypothetical protein MYP_909 [Sporocytophaga myxococcoides]|uniref:Uncharacterized protein n=1 Tax=Sporocytophaga myxococcoides TaxID=153721 RepID=A0A098LB52_9BACT|nr:hypothetical protein [Sporocytophaga myxococcoides]GAL83682.1 hypothetical protein MYP_909 [Sporocytophaga myxococcoides]
MENSQLPTDNTAIVHSFFNIINRGFIIELQHNLNGLAQGAKLVSQRDKSIWEIRARILFDHAIEVHKKFGNENYEFVHISFKDFKDEEASINNILQKESLGIYQYFIFPQGHNNFLDAMEILNMAGS